MRRDVASCRAGYSAAELVPLAVSTHVHSGLYVAALKRSLKSLPSLRRCYDDYISDDYISDDYISDDYISDDYIGDEYYISDDYISDDYISDDYISDDYISDDYIILSTASLHPLLIGCISDDYISDDNISDDYISDDYISDDYISDVSQLGWADAITFSDLGDRKYGPRTGA